MDRIIEKKKWTTRKIIQYAAILAFLFFLLYLLVFRDRTSRIRIEKSSVSIAMVKLDKFTEFIPVDGVVQPMTTIYIDAVLGGTVEKKYVEDGAEVMQGDMILKLSNANMQLSYMDQETRMYDAINNLLNSRIALEQNKFQRQKEITNLLYQIDQVEKEFTRAEKLYKDGVYTLKEFEDAKRDSDFSRKQLQISLELQRLDSVAAEEQKKQIAASVERMKTNLALLQSNMEKLLVRAPADGVLTSFNVEIGETKSAGERLGQIDIMDGFKMRASIDERYVSRIMQNQEAELDFSGKTYRLYVNKIYTGVTGGAFQVDMLFEDEVPDNIKRGQTIQMRLQFSTPTEALILKRGAFFQQTGGNWVFVVDPSGKCASKREIRLGRQNTKYYEVMEGLEADEQVVVSSYENFGNRDKLVFKEK